MVELGGNISLEGFSEVDKGAMVIIKKIERQISFTNVPNNRHFSISYICHPVF